MLNRQQLRRLSRQVGLQPSRISGQNFLVDRAVAEASVRAAELRPTDTVLEVGAGFGSLTEYLLGLAGKVVAVERDPRLAALLKSRHTRQPKLEVEAVDVFRLRLDALVEEGRYKVVANLPYSLTSLFFRNFLTLSPRPELMVLLVQREVAERLRGANGNRSLLTLLAELTASTEVLRLVDRTSFWPVPGVTSALVRLRLKPVPADTESLLRLARMAFASRRKQLRNSLAAGLHLGPATVATCLVAAGVSPSARPQELTAEAWRKIHQLLIDTSSHP